MPKAFFIDTTKCTACRGCQIACKEWKELVPNITLQQGTHQNPPDLNPNNYKLVRFSEFKEQNGTVRWNFFPDQCRHCVDAPCVLTAQGYVPGAFVKDAATGAVYCTELSRKLSKDAFEDIRSACPFDIPRRDAATGLVGKCNMCLERVQKDMLPMCVKTCCTGTMNFGERAEDDRHGQGSACRSEKGVPRSHAERCGFRVHHLPHGLQAGTVLEERRGPRHRPP